MFSISHGFLISPTVNCSCWWLRRKQLVIQYFKDDLWRLCRLSPRTWRVWFLLTNLLILFTNEYEVECCCRWCHSFLSISLCNVAYYSIYLWDQVQYSVWWIQSRASTPRVVKAGTIRWHRCITQCFRHHFAQGTHGSNTMDCGWKLLPTCRTRQWERRRNTRGDITSKA